jgi:hypothetical protein
VRLYYDTEFLEDGRIIDLISIGLVAEDDREYYAVTAREDIIDLAFGHPWLVDHVVPSLPVTTDEAAFRWSWNTGHADWPHVKPPKLIASEVRDFILAEPDPQLWAWYGAYDHVVLCQLWGRMTDLPKGVPMWTNDLKQEAERLGSPQVPQQAEGEHNALADARHNREIAAFLEALQDGIVV